MLNARAESPDSSLVALHTCTPRGCLITVAPGGRIAYSNRNMVSDYRLLGVLFFSIAVFRLCGQEPSATSDTAAPATETIVFLRHGEKPPQENGQLTCQGLNRGLALPKLLIERYGNANFIYAPDPAKKITKDDVAYSYIRALATIEPTAIALGLPIETKFGYKEIDPLQQELLDPRYQRSLVFVAWEHLKLNELVKNILSSLGGDPSAVPEWTNDDYDSIYVVKVQSTPTKRTVTFQHEYEGLNGLSADCPEAKIDSVTKGN